VNSNNKWTAEDDKRLLKLLAARKSSFSIAAQLRRSIQAIRARLGILKAKERFAGSSGETRSMPGTKRWTLDDDRRLMELKAKGTSTLNIYGYAPDHARTCASFWIRPPPNMEVIAAAR